MNKHEIEKKLKTLGSFDDVSEYILEKYRQETPYSYLLFQNKYNDTIDDSITIEVNSDGTFRISNDDLAYDSATITEKNYWEKLFSDTSFNVEISNLRGEDNSYILAVSAKATNWEEVVSLVKLYRERNDQFLADKVSLKLNRNGEEYYDRIDS